MLLPLPGGHRTPLLSSLPPLLDESYSCFKSQHGCHHREPAQRPRRDQASVPGPLPRTSVALPPDVMLGLVGLPFQAIELCEKWTGSFPCCLPRPSLTHREHLVNEGMSEQMNE